MTKANPNIHIKSKDPVNMVTMIVPGRRALGETWSRVEIGQTPDGLVINRSDARDHGIEAPANARPIIAIGAKDQEYADYIITAMAERQKERVENPQEMGIEERRKLINELWQDFMAQKIAHLKGVSQFGAGGFTQRQKVNR